MEPLDSWAEIFAYRFSLTPLWYKVFSCCLGLNERIIDFLNWAKLVGHKAFHLVNH